MRNAIFLLSLTLSFFACARKLQTSNADNSVNNIGPAFKCVQTTDEKTGDAKPFCYQDIHGRVVINGDMDLGAVDDVIQAPELGLTPGYRITYNYCLWSDGIIPYTIDASSPDFVYVQLAINVLNSAFKRVKFVVRTTESHYYKIVFDPNLGFDGGISSVGTCSDTPTMRLKFSAGISAQSKMTVIMHEIMHALGVKHAHARPDRNENIILKTENILDGQMHAFDIVDQEIYESFGSYDLKSIMHYDSYAFSKNNLPTMTKLDGSTFSQSTSLSENDVSMVETLYARVNASAAAISLNKSSYAPGENITVTYSGLPVNTKAYVATATEGAHVDASIAVSLINNVSGNLTIPGPPGVGKYEMRLFTHRYANEVKKTLSFVVEVPPSPPAAPSNLTATATSTSTINLTWNDVATENSYIVQRSLNSEDWSSVATLPANTQSYTSGGLSENTLYYHRVYAQNNGGNSPFSNVVSTKTLLNVPAVPQGLSVVALSSSELLLSWTDVGTEARYKIERSPNGSDNWQIIGTTDADVVSYKDSGLTPNTTYYYRVRGNNATGDGAYSTVASAKTKLDPPAMPKNFSAIAESETKIRLSWEDVATETGYKLERSLTATSGFTVVFTPTANATNYLDTDLAEATRYYYRLAATNGGGDSAFTTVVDATTKRSVPVAPPNVIATALSPEDIKLTWGNVEKENQFKIDRSLTGTGDWQQIAVTNMDVLTFNDKGLAENTTYFYRIRATNESGDSPSSAAASAKTFAKVVPPKAWQKAESLSVGNQDVITGDLAVNKNGDAIVNWLQVDDIGLAIWARVYKKSGGWTDAFRIYTQSAAGKFLDSKVIWTKEDTAHVLYVENDKTQCQLRVRSYSLQQGWLPEKAAAHVDKKQPCAGLQVAANNNGNALVVLPMQSEKDFAFVGMELQNAGTIANPKTIASGAILNPRLVLSDQNQGTVIYLEKKSSAQVALLSLNFGGTTGWSEQPEVIVDEATTIVYHPKVSYNAAKNSFNLVWASRKEGVASIFLSDKSASDATSHWSTPTSVASSATGFLIEPTHFNSTTGNAAIAFVQTDGNQFSLGVAKKLANKPWSTVEYLKNENKDGLFFPHVSLDNAEHVILSWLEGRGAGKNSEMDVLYSLNSVQFDIKADANVGSISPVQLQSLGEESKLKEILSISNFALFSTTTTGEIFCVFVGIVDDKSVLFSNRFLQ